MVETHLYALMPLIVFLILSLVFWGKGLVHLLTFGYIIALALVAVTLQWEVLFFPILTISGIMVIILFIMAMTKGDWL